LHVGVFLTYESATVVGLDDARDDVQFFGTASQTLQRSLLFTALLEFLAFAKQK